MRFIGLSWLVLVCGCTPYMRAQMDLVEQARAGVMLVAEHQEDQSQLVSALHRLRRVRLDEAFDADVRQREALEAEWVIEHRRAYAAAMDLLAESRFASTRADETAKQNLETVLEVLEQLEALIEAPGRWMNR